MILIASGAYVIPEFQIELGKIPPCLLPIGNKKLIELQVGRLNQDFPDEEIYLTLPESYIVSNYEWKIFESLKIQITFIPDAFNLCESLLYFINTTGNSFKDESLYLLHGDTYFSDFNNLTGQDFLTVSRSTDNYNWEVVQQTDWFSLVWSGFFNFSSISYLLRALTINRDNFVDAVKYYREHISLDFLETNKWYDVGHTNTYFNSRANITTQRAFNVLNIENGIVQKRGSPSEKIRAEALWYENIPSVLRQYIPILVKHGEQNDSYYYEIEYLPYMPLNELYVHGKNDIFQWSKILDKFSKFMDSSLIDDMSLSQTEEIDLDLESLYVVKSKNRFLQYLSENNIDIHKKFNFKNTNLPTLEEILNECIDKVLQLKKLYGVMHGDLCFSNILYDSRGDRIKVIDPRGMNYNAKMTILGDIKYDFAKLTHSIVGMYDYIISGYYSIEESANGSIQIVFDIDSRVQQVIDKYISDFEIDGLTVKEVMPLVVLLFFSMLPLHSDRPDRQKAMLLNGLRLYHQFLY
ncbi:hypothetical protein RFH42_02240 [Acinetobacter rudis]|uniref:hypothetical protein n=1 Tax=Acinetobacter rudis TaxID=632955 RepID=UPI00280E4E5F|nr:hypothetical protein [Acinetobacter rudis]MDQ8951778.1 hypothetical protein [Acinetobacter rudis]